MVKKLQKTNADIKGAPHLSSAVKDSAQQIWLAGLGAFSRAQEEGSKVFNTLVKQGMAIQHKTEAAADENIGEATSRISDIASDLQTRAGNPWDKLENIFEDRVAKALGKLGVPSGDEMAALADRVNQLDKQIQALNTQSATARPKAKSTAVPKAARKASASSVPMPAAKKTARPAIRRAAKAASPSTGSGDGPAQNPAK